MKAKYTNKDINHKFDFQSRLGYSIQGKRGGAPQIKDDIGSVCVFVDNPTVCKYGSGNTIKVEAFQGIGDTYERMEKCKIIICNNDEQVFNGDFMELVTKLRR